MKNACTFDLENALAGTPVCGPVCGLDEVGRGPLAGPVTAACVYVPPEMRNLPFWADVTDSKKLSAAKRETLSAAIIRHCPYGIAECSVAEIDRLNILQASLLAMARALEKMTADFNIHPALALVDGNRAPALPCAVQTVVKGDSISHSIAAASILAKVARDRTMAELAAAHPGYGWDGNAGYGTAHHIDALKKHGPTPHHRRSFAPVRATLSA